jgi:hypothetical protein
VASERRAQFVRLFDGGVVRCSFVGGGVEAKLTREMDDRSDDGSYASLSQLSDARIAQVFAMFDTDRSKDLDTFELSNAITDLLRRPPTTKQVRAMLLSVEHTSENTLTLAQFTKLVREFDWEGDDLLSELGDQLYELSFERELLGFRVRSVQDEGIIVVSDIVDPTLEGSLGVDDTVVAVNGAPLGFVTDHRVRQQNQSPHPLRHLGLFSNLFAI